ncbi:MAG: tRNA (guanosine(46)-N7)-methyltransferase TrmB [Planctomycetes bacterium]|nr:tRNA (guanosine(46)-N7)-methyltransferase TrmB [Planctomycetota bacterium]
MSERAHPDLRPWGWNQRDLTAPEQGRIAADFFFPGRDESRPFEIEIGSGKGTFLVQEATRCPERDFLGVENAGEFFRHATDRVRRHALPNVRMLYADAVEFIAHWLPDGCVAIIHLYFSDPWPKARHHKRRVLQHAALAQFHRVLRPGGEVRLVTDHDELWKWYEELLAAQDLFTRKAFAPPASAEAGEVVGTNFERKYRREGRPFHATTLVKRS